MELSWDDLGDQDNGFDIEIESSELDSDDLPDKLCDEGWAGEGMSVRCLRDA